MARKQRPAGVEVAQAAEHRLEGFAEDLGRLLGTARTKAENWLGQRQQIAKTLQGIRDTATHLLTELGHEAQSIVRRGRAAATRKAGGRAGTRKRGPGRPKARTMSAEAREKIRQAQLRRWAKVKAAGKRR